MHHAYSMWVFAIALTGGDDRRGDLVTSMLVAAYSVRLQTKLPDWRSDWRFDFSFMLPAFTLGKNATFIYR